MNCQIDRPLQLNSRRFLTYYCPHHFSSYQYFAASNMKTTMTTTPSTTNFYDKREINSAAALVQKEWPKFCFLSLFLLSKFFFFKFYYHSYRRKVVNPKSFFKWFWNSLYYYYYFCQWARTLCVKFCYSFDNFWSTKKNNLIKRLSEWQCDQMARLKFLAICSNDENM